MDDTGYFVETDELLHNKLGITDPAQLASTEYDITARKTSEVIATLHPTVFDFALLLDLHRRLFEDIYDFAGKVRTVNISKPDSPVPFCYCDFIPSESDRIFGELKRDNYLVHLDHDNFVDKLTYYASELNALHPFREGNGRTTRLYLDLLCNHAGYIIDFAFASRRAILYADTQAFAGNLEPLHDLYRQIVIKL